jgi:hypothetical protein
MWISMVKLALPLLVCLCSFAPAGAIESIGVEKWRQAVFVGIMTDGKISKQIFPRKPLRKYTINAARYPGDWLYVVHWDTFREFRDTTYKIREDGTINASKNGKNTRIFVDELGIELYPPKEDQGVIRKPQQGQAPHPPD